MFTSFRSAVSECQWGRAAVRTFACVPALLACLGVFGASAWGASSMVLAGSSSAAKPSVSVDLEQCLTTGVQSERSATFGGEMATIPGAARMLMRVDVLERAPGELHYHAVSAPGLGVWRSSAPGVKVYKYLKQVTDLPAPAFYRGAVRFRWLNAHGRQMAATELRTPRCEQPPLPESPSTPVGSSAAIGGV